MHRVTIYWFPPPRLAQDGHHPPGLWDEEGKARHQRTKENLIGVEFFGLAEGVGSGALRFRQRFFFCNFFNIPLFFPQWSLCACFWEFVHVLNPNSRYTQFCEKRCESPHLEKTPLIAMPALWKTPSDPSLKLPLYIPPSNPKSPNLHSNSPFFSFPCFLSKRETTRR